jgi:hypothetical protein
LVRGKIFPELPNNLLQTDGKVLHEIALFAILSRRNSYNAFEMTIEMALAAKAGFIRRVRKLAALPQKMFGALDAQVDHIFVRRQPDGFAKRAQ